MIHATFIRLPASAYPWCWALRIYQLDRDTFAAFLAAFKEAVPHRARKWVAERRYWMLYDGQVETVCYVLGKFGLTFGIEGGPSMDDTPPPPPPNHRQSARAEAARRLYLQPDAPDFLIDAAYRALAKRCHPDAGGSKEAMQAINEAMTVLRRSG